MSRRPLVSALLLGALLVPPFAAALPVPDPSPGGPCLSPGSPPDRLPDVATGGCGPRVILHVRAPAADLDFELDVGPCRMDCDVTFTIDVLVCSGWVEQQADRALPPVGQPVERDTPFVDQVLEAVGDEVAPILGQDPTERVVEVETFLSCD